MERRVILSLDFDSDVITDVLIVMGGEYQRFLTDTATYSLDAIKICNHLVAKGYLAGCEKKNGKIIIHKNEDSSDRCERVCRKKPMRSIEDYQGREGPELWHGRKRFFGFASE